MNLRHYFFAAQAVAPGMKRAGGGAIINLGSVSWHLALPDLRALRDGEGRHRRPDARAGARSRRSRTSASTASIPGAVRTPRQMALWHTPEEEAKILAQQCLKARVEPVRRGGDGAVPRLRRCAPCARRTATGWTPATAEDEERNVGDVECVWPVGAELGEGPFWSAAEQAVWFVDIKGRAIHRFHEPSGETRSWPAPARSPGFIAADRATAA